MQKTIRTVALIGALCWVALSADSLRDPSVQSYRDGLLLAPWLMFGAVLAGFHYLRGRRGGRPATAGLIIALTGTVLGTVGGVGLLVDNDVMEAVNFPASPLCFLAGLALYGTAMIRARVLPLWAGLLVALAQVNCMVIGIALSWYAPLQPHGSFTGALGHAAAMFAIAAALSSGTSREPHRAVPQPSA